MDAAFREILLGGGAVIEAGTSRVQHFGDAAAELSCAFESCVLADRSDLGRLLATGPDILNLLNRLSTAEVRSLARGDGRPTVLTSPKGRIVERLFVHHLGEAGVLLVGGPASGAKVMEHIGRFTFQEKTGLSDVTDATCQLVLIGPRAADALEALALPRPAVFHAAATSLAGAAVHVLGEQGLSGTGFSLVAATEHRIKLWRELANAVFAVEGRPAGELALESYRILRGIPLSGRELTDEHNPLEAGLWDAVSFDKGCYVGQEVVARLRTYDKVARSIIGLEMPAGRLLPEHGTPLLIEEREVGRLTSVVVLPGEERAVGLGYVKRREIADRTEVQVGPGGPTAQLVPLPFQR